MKCGTREMVSKCLAPGLCLAHRKRLSLRRPQYLPPPGLWTGRRAFMTRLNPFSPSQTSLHIQTTGCPRHGVGHVVGTSCGWFLPPLHGSRVCGPHCLCVCVCVVGGWGSVGRVTGQGTGRAPHGCEKTSLVFHFWGLLSSFINPVPSGGNLENWQELELALRTQPRT